MQYILFCILSNVGIFLCFRGFSQFNINTFQAIVINYLVCVITGIFFIGNLSFIDRVNFTEPWVLMSLFLGSLFICAFYVMALTTQRLGITAATIAAKMSLVIPVVVSVGVLMIQSREYIFINYLGIVMALVAIVMASLKKRNREDNTPKGLSIILMPMAVFVLGGAIDTTINYTNHFYLPESESAVFPLIIFGCAFFIGATVLIIGKSKIEFKNIVGGTVLGVINYFSLYYIVKALTAFNNDGAIVYPVLNVGIILMSSLVSRIIYKERLSVLNKGGLVMAVLAIIFIFYQEILAYY